MRRALLAVLLFSCARPAHWPPRAAEHPPTREELAAWELTVKGPPEFARALRDLGFHVVDHPPYHRQLEVTLEPEGETLVATLRSDGWFVDEALGASPAELARTLAVSDRLKQFFRNSGLPQQRDLPEQ